MASLLTDQTPAGRRKRLMFAGGGAIVLALLFLLTRGGSAPADDSTAGVDLAGATGIPTTFADNGAAMGQLTDYVGGGLAGVTAALDNVATSQTTFGETLAESLQGQQAILDAIDAKAAPTQLASSGQPTNTDRRQNKQIKGIRKQLGRIERRQKAKAKAKAKAKPKNAARRESGHRGNEHAAARPHDPPRHPAGQRNPSKPSHPQIVLRKPHRKR